MKNLNLPIPHPHNLHYRPHGQKIDNDQALSVFTRL